MKNQTKKPNRLIQQTSPYLLQHAYNPVDWYPWGDEAFQKSKRENKPIFLSVGYSACHWCHVMEKESFEDKDTASILNEHFVSIKVDREERPDVDQVYMQAVQMMTHHGGWPMSVFLTSEGDPFYGGTYFPPDDKMGMPSFKRVLGGVMKAWKEKREDAINTAKQYRQVLDQIFEVKEGNSTIFNKDIFKTVHLQYQSLFDKEDGGFGSAPKFFHIMDQQVCLRHYKDTSQKEALEMVTTTLKAISKGGIFDHLGGGFHRYSTDAIWLVPHFEKMLYDNALLVKLMVEAYQVTKDSAFLETIHRTLSYVQREMTSAEGGFYSAQDADSEGEEGKYYVWTKAEIKGLLGDRAESFCETYQVSDVGNWEEGKNILHLKSEIDPAAWATEREILLQARQKRVAPIRDEKILVSWNGLMIEAFALAYQITGEEGYLLSAQKAARFIFEKMMGAQGLSHSYVQGKVQGKAFLDDNACFIRALATLFECDFDERWIEKAKEIAQGCLNKFWDSQSNTFYFTSQDQDTLIVRPREYYDNALPSATGTMIEALIRVGKITGEMQFLDAARQCLQALNESIEKNPRAVGQLLVALGYFVYPSQELIIFPAGAIEEEGVLEMFHKLHQKFLPQLTSYCGTPEMATHFPIVKGKEARENKITAFLCENFTCLTPIMGKEEVSKLIETL